MNFKFNNIVSWCLVALISLVIIEISAFFAYTPVFGKRLTRDSIKVELLRGSIDYEPGNATDQKYADFVENKVLHPYLGFVYKPLDEQNDWQNFYGFHGGKTLQKKSPDKVIVAVSGGSFALGLINDSTDTLIREIKKIPQYNDKAIEVVGIAIGGFKQPQQLMALSYLLSQGAEFDVWINLDGFNEITLPIVENYLAGVSLSYPRLWKLYAKKAFDRDTLDILANIHSVKRSRENHKKMFQPFSWSNLGLIFWKLSDIAKEKEEYRLNEILNKSLSQERISYQVSGPFEKYPNDFSAIEAASEIWYRSSLQMRALCKENGIKYIHLLQPNQYVPGSKPMGQQERLIAIQEGPYIYKDLVVSGYPMLMNRGAKLRSQGVEFYDLSMVFKDNAEVIYSDSLCHINKLGNDFMAKKICELVK